MRARTTFLCLILAGVTVAPASVAHAAHRRHAGVKSHSAPKWVRRIDAVVGDLPVGVEIGFHGDVLYAHKDWVERPPASNEKLLLSMALLNRVSANTTIPTRVLATRAPAYGVIHGDLWLMGHGDPETNRSDLRTLATSVAAAGIRKIQGHVEGATGPFARDWFAPGWKDYFPTYYCALPTALTYHFNTDLHGRNIVDPERRAATELTKQLKRAGVRVTKKPGMGSPPSKLTGVATVQSDPLRAIMHRMDLWSRNFYAEVLGKYLGTRTAGSPGTIAKGASAIEAYARANGVKDIVANDGSGLSYKNRVSPSDIVKLLHSAEGQTWGDTLRSLLAHGGQGTLEDRLADVKLRAKTGTLDSVSALSGWVWMKRQRDWAEFSILSSGISKTRSIHIENAIVRVVNANASSS
jgi:D-alanyl-D-alanine carboxypeptidase/D-alanyl-D-alanine-endopeptidase (penicillin-binding protein 4)